MRSYGWIAFLLLLGGATSPLRAQLAGVDLPLTLEAHIGAGVPTGDFAGRTEGIEAGPGFAIGGGAVLEVTDWLGVYGDYQWARYACAECGDVEMESSTDDVGLEAGAEVLLPVQWRDFRPWVRGGVVRRQLAVSGEGGRQASEPGLGYAAAVGARISYGRFSVAPGIHYRSYPAEFRFESLPARSLEVNALTFDLGLQFHL